CYVDGEPGSSRRFGQRAVEEFALKPVGCAADETPHRKERFQHHRIFVILGAKSLALTGRGELRNRDTSYD
ncbi:MAG: hypothetical protein WBW45_15275, partial [Bradyrhizobium sp.]